MAAVKIITGTITNLVYKERGLQPAGFCAWRSNPRRLEPALLKSDPPAMGGIKL